MKTCFGLLGSLIILFINSCASSYRTSEGLVWNTAYHITYNSGVDMTDSVMAVLKAVEMSVSPFNPASTVSKINNNSDMRVDPYFREVYEMSRVVWDESNGAFDPTLAPLINAYGFGYRDSIHVDEQVIDSIKEFVGLGRTGITESGELQKNDPRMEFNFSAIAKGYACDKVAEMFIANGITDFMIEIGGEITVNGDNPDGEKWRISVDAPIESADRVVHKSQTVIALENQGVATSGNYRNYRDKGGRRIGHTIDPYSGEPAVTDIASVTVVAETCMEADAYATACMAVGSDRAKYILQHIELPAMLVLTDGTVWKTPSFEELEQDR